MDTPGSPHNRLVLPQTAFKKEAAEDPYLSGPSELEDFSFDRPTSSGSLHQDPARHFSPISPLSVEQISHQAMQGFDYGENSFGPSNLFDFDLSGSSDPGFHSSVTTSPGPDDLVLRANGGAGQLPSDFETMDSRVPKSTAKKRQASLESFPQARIDSDFVTDVPTTILQDPGLMSVDNSQFSRLDVSNSTSDIHRVGAGASGFSMPSQSPLVKVSTYSRGDSPTRDEDGQDQRGSRRSSVHLAPRHTEGDESEIYGDSTGLGLVGHDYNSVRATDGSWIRNPTTGQAGLDPSVRGNEIVPSPREVEEERHRAEKNLDIEIWSEQVSVASDVGDDYMVTNHTTRQRPRSASAVETRQDYFSIMQRQVSDIPGPGQLIRESEPGSDFETASYGSHPSTSDDGLPLLESSLESDPIIRHFIRKYPWEDQTHLAIPVPTKSQPESSRAAMQLYEDLAKEFETASRVATWGTKRLTDVEVDSLIESEGFLKNLSISKSSILKLLPKRSNSTGKHKRRASQAGSQTSNVDGEPPHQDHEGKKEGVTGSMLSRRSSLNRPRSPSGVVVLLTSQMATSIGGHSSILAAPKPSQKGGLSPSSLIGRFRQHRSKSEGARAAPDLKDLNLDNSRPPIVPTPAPQPRSATFPEADEADDDDDDSVDDKGILMDLTPSSRQIVPTLDGFRKQVSELNPRLQQPLVDRFANEQLRRFKKLVNDKTKHAAAVDKGKCTARHRCSASGGQPQPLPPKPNAKDPNATHCQFRVSGPETSDDDSKALMDGSIAPAVFPPGVPLPPVQKLPAEFECTLCFKAKKFYKPSDWTKHVYEDILPFTCTFPNCSGPKSFKRKADWVRHENELHRQLEWWTCNMPDCDHKCYRKNNFVQHLVREHKVPEPRSMEARSSAGAEEPDVASLWQLVDECHIETNKSPKEEPCRFCGNVCDDWKKLTVHLAKHMEQIALPILPLVARFPSPTGNAIKVQEKVPIVSPVSPAPSVGMSTYSPEVVSRTDPSMDSTMMTRQSSYDTSHSSDQQNPNPTPRSLMLSPGMAQSDVPLCTSYPPASQYSVSNSAYLDPYYTPGYRNNRSYPPASPMPTRQPTSFIPMPAETTTYGLNLSTDGIAGPQQQLYQSPTAESLYTAQDGLLPNMFNESPNLGIPIATSPDGEHLSAGGYMQQNHSPTYPM